MRWLLLVALCSSCSLVYDVDGLRGRDGGLADSGADSSADSGVADGDVGTDAAPDTGGVACEESTHPRPLDLEEVDSSTILINFGAPADAEARYRVEAQPGVLETELILPAESATATLTLSFAVALFQPPLTLIDADGCATALEFPFYSAEVFSDDGTEVLGTSFAPGTSVDVADDGTVVFTANTIGAGADARDDIFRWAPDGSLATVTTSPIDIQGLASPRISDDGRLITYWQAKDDTGMTGFFQYAFDETVLGSFNDETGSLTCDLRVDASGTYHFVMRAFPFDGSDTLFYRGLGVTELSGGPMSLNALDPIGRSPHLRLNDDATVDVAFVAVAAPMDPSEVLASRDVPTGGTEAVDGCTITANAGLAATDGAAVALVGTCDGVGPRLHVRLEGDHLDFEIPTDPTVNGLLSVDQAFETFLVRGPSSRWVVRKDGDGFEARPIDRDPITAAVTFLDTAALSPNGEWVALSLANPADVGNPQSFRVARLRVRSATP